MVPKKLSTSTAATSNKLKDIIT